MRFHWQNLNEKKGGKTGSILRHGRAWLGLGRYYRPTLRWEWRIPTTHFHLGVSFGEPYENTVQFTLACGLFALWVTFEGRGWSWLPTDRRCELSFHDKALWIHPWSRTWEWNRNDSWWVRGLTIHFDDLLLGRHKHASRTLSTHDVLIPMPEGCYPATVKIEEHTWKRPRWFRKTRVDAWVDISTGIPHEGKGTASWNCGEDGLWGCGCTGASVEKAIGHVVATVLEYRRRYGKPRDLKPVMSPRVKAKAEAPPETDIGEVFDKLGSGSFDHIADLPAEQFRALMDALNEKKD